MDQMTIRLDDEVGSAFRRAMRDGFRSQQQQARKYIIEGLRRDGLLPDERQAQPEREQASSDAR